jgi:hypothetical protein
LMAKPTPLPHSRPNNPQLTHATAGRLAGRAHAALRVPVQIAQIRIAGDDAARSTLAPNQAAGRVLIWRSACRRPSGSLVCIVLTMAGVQGQQRGPALSRLTPAPAGWITVVSCVTSRRRWRRVHSRRGAGALPGPTPTPRPDNRFGAVRV